MRKILIGRSVRILGALLAIAGSALGGRAPNDPIAAVAPIAVVELATSARLEVDALPGDSPAALSSPADRTLRSASAESRADDDGSPSGGVAPRSISHRGPPPRGSAHARPSGHHHAGHLARSGAVSSFGTSIPPPLSA